VNSFISLLALTSDFFPEQYPVALIRGTWEGYVRATLPFPKTGVQIELERAGVGLLHDE
jgi:hypothetical protein